MGWDGAVLEDVSCDEDIDPGEEGGEGTLPPQLHLHVDEEVPRVLDGPVQVDGAGVGIEFSCAEEAVLIPLGDAEDDVVSSVGRGGAYAEDLGGDDYVGLEAQLVVGYPHWCVLALHKVCAADALAACVRDSPEVCWTLEGQAAESAVDVVAGFL